ncbi:MAG: hypothetical protein KC766_40165 [Myxococcales bacterium]|nr:hypothetical protein [Myxococcales bacterium]
MAEDQAAAPQPPKRPRLAWSRGRWALLALGAGVAAHWYVSRRTATETAARLHGAASQFAACVAGARPPDPMSPEARRGLEAMLFKRLALSLSKAKPLTACEPLLAEVTKRANIHADNFYRRAPNEVSSIQTIAQRLQTLDFTQEARQWSRKPGDGSESPTLQLIADTQRLLQLTCQVAQAEKAYDVGACPLTGETARGLPDPRLALEVGLGDPIADFELRASANPAPRLTVAARGRRGKFGAWLAGAFAQPGAAASWRTLSLNLPALPPPPPDRSLPRLELQSSQSELRVTQSFAGAGRAFSADPGLSKATLGLSLTAPRPADSGTAAVPSARLVPLPNGASAWIHMETAGETRIDYYDARGQPLSSQRLDGAPLATGAAPPRLFLRGDGLEVRRLDSDAPDSKPLAEQPFPPDHTLLQSLDGCGAEPVTALLGRSDRGASLLTYDDTARAGDSFSWKLDRGTRPSLVCGLCPPRVLEATGDALALRRPSDDPQRTQAIDTPVLFGANAALQTDATCVDRTTLLAYVVGGAVLVQRVMPGGSEAPTEVARPSEQGNATHPTWLLLPPQDAEPPRLLLFWRRAGGKTRSDLLRIEFAESADLGKSWH